MFKVLRELTIQNIVHVQGFKRTDNLLCVRKTIRHGYLHNGVLERPHSSQRRWKLKMDNNNLL